MDFQAEYRSKLRTPAEAVRAVKNGDWVDYTSGLGFPSSATRSRRIFSTTRGTARRMSAGSATAACATSRR